MMTNQIKPSQIKSKQNKAKQIKIKQNKRKNTNKTSQRSCHLLVRHEGISNDREEGRG